MNRHPLDLFTGWNVARYSADEKCFVHDRNRVRRMHRRTAAGVVYFFACAALSTYILGWDRWGAHGPLLLILFVLGASMGWAASRAALATWQRAYAYRNGWIEGRAHMIMSMAEAQERGLSQQEWRRAMWEKDEGIW